MPKRAAPDSETKKPWWSEGVQFECQGSGKCCTSHGEFGYVYFSEEDRKRAAEVLNISEAEFRKQYCTRVDGHWALREPASGSLDCIFLKEKRCSIYAGRPTQCRTWPFWPEVMGAKAWTKAVANFCPGVGKGSVIPAEKIRATLAEEAENSQSIYNEK